jgi:hypothetical protein
MIREVPIRQGRGTCGRGRQPRRRPLPARAACGHCAGRAEPERAPASPRRARGGARCLREGPWPSQRIRRLANPLIAKVWKAAHDLYPGAKKMPLTKIVDVGPYIYGGMHPAYGKTPRVTEVSPYAAIDLVRVLRPRAARRLPRTGDTHPARLDQRPAARVGALLPAEPALAQQPGLPGRGWRRGLRLPGDEAGREAARAEAARLRVVRRGVQGLGA